MGRQARDREPLLDLGEGGSQRLPLLRASIRANRRGCGMRNLISVLVLLPFTVGLAGCGGQPSAQETDTTSTSNY